LILSEFFQVALAELDPLIGVPVKPLAQLGGRGEISEPMMHAGVRLSQTPRPQAIYEDTSTVAAGGFFVNALHGNGHRTLHLY
jgi:hypothetical protein